MDRRNSRSGKVAMMFVVLASVFWSSGVYAQTPIPNGPQLPAVNAKSTNKTPCAVTNFKLPEVFVSAKSGQTKFIRLVYVFDEQCNIKEAERLALDNVPLEILQSVQTEGYSVHVGVGPIPSSIQPDSVLGSGSNTAHVKIIQFDCCFIQTISLQTDQAWWWTENTSVLSGNPYTLASWCCSWWHIVSGPSQANGSTSSSEVWARGSVQFECHGSDPYPFCTGPNAQYPMWLFTALNMYPNGAASPYGTTFSGVVIPAGRIEVQFWVT